MYCMPPCQKRPVGQPVRSCIMKDILLVGQQLFSLEEVASKGRDMYRQNVGRNTYPKEAVDEQMESM